MVVFLIFAHILCPSCAVLCFYTLVFDNCRRQFEVMTDMKPTDAAIDGAAWIMCVFGGYTLLYI